MEWQFLYHFFLIIHLFLSFPRACTILLLFTNDLPLLPLLLQVEMTPAITGGVLLEGVVTIQPPAVLGVKKGPSSGHVVGESIQVAKDVESVPTFAPIVTKDLEASQFPIPQDPKSN